jgi:hypothetical protein
MMSKIAEDMAAIWQRHNLPMNANALTEITHWLEHLDAMQRSEASRVETRNKTILNHIDILNKIAAALGPMAYYSPDGGYFSTYPNVDQILALISGKESTIVAQDSTSNNAITETT